MATLIERQGTASTAHLDDTDQERVTRKWAKEVRGWSSRAGGWIYNAQGTAITQGWGSVWHHYKMDILDWLTARLTAFTSFHEMCRETGETYSPTLIAKGKNAADIRALADAYDSAQSYYGDSRRAFRGQGYERYVVARSGRWYAGWVILDTVTNHVALEHGTLEYSPRTQAEAQRDADSMNRLNARGKAPYRRFGAPERPARVA